ncbi:MAG: GtrA family protein [Lachnospiraceae bacterium]|nr:GtrA family protein [Lachnospiraceae bacterium]MDO4409288.1 GtrA family protein [Eubacteriales bacterium]
MTKLIQQFLKFGVVGVICFFIDTGLYTICNFIGIPYLISGVIGFSVSVVVNYLLSMKYVFVRRDDLSRKKEFTIYLILSIIGLILNELILFVCVDVIYGNWSWLRSFMHPRAAEILAKIGATGIVMVYNFVTRKIFMERRD